MKLYTAKKKKKKIGRKILALIVLCLLCFGLFKGCLYTINSLADINAFKITEINVIAPKHIQKAQILTLCGISKGQGIFNVSTSEAKKRIKTHPWVKNVRVKRSLPSTIEIIVQSKDVRAMTKENDTIYYIDDEGKVIDRLIPGFKTNMPVINSKAEEFPKIIQMLDEMKSIKTGDNLLDSDISEVFLEENVLTIYPSQEHMKIRINPDKMEAILTNIKKVLDDLRSRGESVAVIDATLPGNKVVVRGIRK